MTAIMRKFVCSFALLALFLAACGKKEEPSAAVIAPAPVASAPAKGAGNTEEKLLNIYNWPDYLPEGKIAALNKESGTPPSWPP